jgi:hypothetical protein
VTDGGIISKAGSVLWSPISTNQSHASADIDMTCHELSLVFCCPMLETNMADVDTAILFPVIGDIGRYFVCSS